MGKISNKDTRTWLRIESAYATPPANWSDQLKVSLLHSTGASVKKNLAKEQDKANMGGKYPAGYTKTKESVEGNLPVTFHPEQFATLAFLGLGAMTTEKAYSGFMAVFYSGNADSCLIERTAAGKLTVKIGVPGAEVADTNFNSTGEIDLSSPGFDTMAELAEAISGYTGYKVYSHGEGASLSTTIPVFTAKQAKGQSVKLEFIDSESTVYRHRIKPIVGGGKPSFSLINDKIISFEQVTGAKGDNFSINAAAGGLLSMELAYVAKTLEKILALPSGIITTYEKTGQIAAGQMLSYINGVLQGECTSSKIVNAPGLFKDSYELGSYQISEPDDTTASLKIDHEYFYTTGTQHIEEKWDNGDEVELAYYIESKDLVETGKPYAAWIRIPRCAILDSQAPIGSDGVIKMPSSFEALSPLYEDVNGYGAIEIDILSKRQTF